MTKTLGMWYSSRAETDGHRVVSMNMSTYLHRDVGYEQPSQNNRAKDVQRLCQPWAPSASKYNWTYRAHFLLLGLGLTLCHKDSKNESANFVGIQNWRKFKICGLFWPAFGYCLHLKAVILFYVGFSKDYDQNGDRVS